MPPAFIVHTYAQTVAALTAAVCAGRPVALLSAPSAARSLGAAAFLKMIALARQAVPEADSLAILDCGTAGGLAVAALKAGAEAILVAVAETARVRLDDIARQTGGCVIDTPPRVMGDTANLDDPARLATLLYGGADGRNCGM